MKLCYFYTDITLKGGIERVLSLLLAGQADNPNLDITLVSQYRSFDTPHFSFPKNIQIVYLSKKAYKGSPGSIHSLYLQLKNRRNVRKFFQENKFDLIASQAFPNTFMLYLAGVELKHVISVEHVYWGYYGIGLRIVRTCIYKKLKAVVVLTEKDKLWFMEYISSVFVIPNPIILNNRFHSPLNSRKIIAMGRLEYQKGFDTLIRVFSHLCKKHADWELNIYGDGSLKEDLQRMIYEYGLENHFYLRGVTKDVLSKLRESAFFVFSSRFEGFGMALVEAMSQGVPCVSFDCPNGPSDIITNGKDGLLVENQDEDELLKSMERLIYDFDLRKKLGDAAYMKVENFSINAILDKWNDLYIQLGVYNK